MATPDTRTAIVKRSLAAIGEICDRGFALAVHIRLTRPTLLYQTYASDWTDNYSIKGYMMTDPVGRAGALAEQRLGSAGPTLPTWTLPGSSPTRSPSA